MLRSLLLGSLLMLTACASCKVKEDSSLLTAHEAGDLTLVLVSPEYGPLDGFAPIRAVEGGRPDQVVRAVVPAVKCHRDSCISVQVVRKDGGVVPIGSVKKGGNSIDIPLSRLTGLPDEVARADGGPYRVLVDVFQLVAEGSDTLVEAKQERGEVISLADFERRRQMSGVIYLTVLARGYARLTCGGPDVAYVEKISKTCTAEYSTKMRSALCGACR